MSKEEKAQIVFNARINDIKSTCESVGTMAYLTKREIMRKIIGHAQFFIRAEDSNFKGDD